MAFQQTGQRKLNRSDHIWHFRAKIGTWKCVLCGGTCVKPPDHPTPKEWLPDCFEKVTDEDRALCPCKG